MCATQSGPHETRQQSLPPARLHLMPATFPNALLPDSSRVSPIAIDGNVSEEIRTQTEKMARIFSTI
jgi:hypothetical protein